MFLVCKLLMLLTRYLLSVLCCPNSGRTPRKEGLEARKEGGGDFSLDGLVKDAIETLDEGSWVFEWDAFEEESLIEE